MKEQEKQSSSINTGQGSGLFQAHVNHGPLRAVAVDWNRDPLRVDAHGRLEERAGCPSPGEAVSRQRGRSGGEGGARRGSPGAPEGADRPTESAVCGAPPAHPHTTTPPPDPHPGGEVAAMAPHGREPHVGLNFHFASHFAPHRPGAAGHAPRIPSLLGSGWDKTGQPHCHTTAAAREHPGLPLHNLPPNPPHPALWAAGGRQPPHLCARGRSGVRGPAPRGSPGLLPRPGGAAPAASLLPSLPAAKTWGKPAMPGGGTAARGKPRSSPHLRGWGGGGDGKRSTAQSRRRSSPFIQSTTWLGDHLLTGSMMRAMGGSGARGSDGRRSPGEGRGCAERQNPAAGGESR